MRGKTDSSGIVDIMLTLCSNIFWITEIQNQAPNIGFTLMPIYYIER